MTPIGDAMPNIKAQHVSIKNITAALAAIAAGAGLVMGSVRFIVGTADSRYVQRDTLVAYRQSQALRQASESTDNARRDSLLFRVDARVGAIYCASLPTNRQAGCR